MTSQLREFDVKATPAHAARDERNGWTIRVTARNKSEAIKYARREIANAGHPGRISFRAVDVAELEAAAAGPFPIG